MQAVDYSTARPDPAELAQRFAGVLRYLAPLPNRKVADRAEIDALHAAGLSVGFVWETGASRAGQGYSAGVQDAQQANGLADNLGIPDTVTIYFAVDFDANPDAIVGYFQGVGSINRRPVGGYGSYTVIERLLDDGLIGHAWQTVAWSRGKRSARAHLFQRADATANPPPGTDVNEILQDDWGQWSPQGDDDMFDDNDRAKLDHLDARVGAIDLLSLAVLGPNGLRQQVADLQGKPAAVIDEKAVAAALAPMLSSNAQHLTDADLAAIAKAVNDEDARRKAN